MSAPPNQAIASAASPEAARLSDLSPQQWKSGIAAWLGWLFDGLDMHLYTLVATPFVAELLGGLDQRDAAVGRTGSIVQAGFLVGWALGGGFFGRVGDRIGRTRALNVTILTYALFTGLSFFAQTWWQLLVCRFLAALGIGGEWAVGAALISETWPRRWRPWMAAVLQSAVNVGVVLAMVAGFLLSGFPPRTVFLVGVLPAFLVVWIRRAVPEPEEWHAARSAAAESSPGVADLFRGDVQRTTILTTVVCSLSLTAHWAFLYWYLQHLRNHPDVGPWTDGEKTAFCSQAMILVMVASIFGNFLAAFFARSLGYRRSIAFLFIAYFAAMLAAYATPLPEARLFWMLAPIGVCQGVFGLFTMYLPPLFPTLLRTTGAGFCYTSGRLAAAAGTIVFGLFSQVGDHRLALLYAAWLFLPAAAVAWLLPEPPDEIAAHRR